MTGTCLQSIAQARMGERAASFSSALGGLPARSHRTRNREMQERNGEARLTWPAFRRKILRTLAALPPGRVQNCDRRGLFSACGRMWRRGREACGEARPRFIAAAICLGVSAATLWAAALTPQFWPVWSGEDPLGPLARHPTLWRWNSALFLTSALVALPGTVLAVPSLSTPAGMPFLTLLTLATALWTADTLHRYVVLPGVVQGRGPGEGSRSTRVLSRVAGGWLVAAGLLIVVFAALGVLILATGVLPAWAGWTTLSSAVFSTAVFIAIRDMPPVIVYLPLLPLTAAAVSRTRGAR